MATVPMPFGPWSPDVEALNNQGLTTVRNVLPASAGAYRPLKRPALLTATILSTRPRGAFTAEDSTGNSNVFAASLDRLYRADPSTQGWANVSKASGYTTNPDERVRFAEFGELVISTNYADPPQVFDTNSGTAFSDLTSLVRARFLAVTRGFVVLANTQDALDGPVRHRVRWSGLENPFDFSPSVTTQSDFQDLPEGGAITGLVGGEALYILQQRKITKASYVGSPIIFQFDPLTVDLGCAYPNSLITVGTQTFFLSEDGFFVLEGDRITSIGDSINESFFRDADPGSWQHMSVAADPTSKLILWNYASISAPGGVPDRLLALNYATGAWTMCDSGPCAFIYSSVSLPTTLEQLDRYGSLENVPASLDSSQWAGGAGYLAALDMTGNVYSFAGAPMPATLETGEWNVASLIAAMSQQPISGDRSVITGIRPLVHGPATVSARIGSRTTPLSDDIAWSQPSTMNVNGVCPQRIEGRYHRVRVEVSGPWERLMGIEIEATPSGFR